MNAVQDRRDPRQQRRFVRELKPLLPRELQGELPSLPILAAQPVSHPAMSSL